MTYGTFAGSSKMAAQKESKVFSTGVVEGGAFEDGHKGDGGAGLLF
jgi:uncharacterized membrane protein